MKKNKLLLTATSSLISAILTSFLLHPLDVVKTRQQVAATSDGAVVAYSTLISSISFIINTEGVFGLYRGLNGQLVASGISWFIFRYLFDFIRYSIEECKYFSFNYRVKNQKYVYSTNISPFSNSFATIIASILSTALVHPLWLVKSRLEMQSLNTKKKGWRQYSTGLNGIVECIYSIYQSNGICGLYSGFIPSLLLIPHTLIQLVIYDILRTKSMSCASKCLCLNNLHFFFNGFISKLLASTLTYPLQVIRSRMQMSKLEDIKLNVYEVNILKLSRKEFISFVRDHYFPGIMTHIPKVSIHNGIMFLIYEVIIRLLESLILVN
ncbi:mitochondrial membrane associated flavin transporter [Cryptosporidium ubiquitum]|uniref:Mitochondrial membrane associated flavin transporter n=1 Tax=Cryptosporidium ubiquitum TaxID=857276 RepID=A0A1J4MKX1_9CRYT|nr:mitochondrial membrane associated flavin transporter [Cryptosporidium ubiquitum]OII74679.1 mitochondrial membrane associated flavin transporter [Cryptosporidium ubiquitum]